MNALLGIWAGTGPAPTSAVCLTHTISCRTLQFIESMIHSNGTNKRKLNDNTRYSLTSFLIDLIGSLKRNSYVWAINEKIWKKRGIPIAIEEQFDIDHLERLLRRSLAIAVAVWQ